MRFTPNTIFVQCISKNIEIPISKFAQVMRTNLCNGWFPSKVIVSFDNNVFPLDFSTRVVMCWHDFVPEYRQNMCIWTCLRYFSLYENTLHYLGCVTVTDAIKCQFHCRQRRIFAGSVCPVAAFETTEKGAVFVFPLFAMKSTQKLQMYWGITPSIFVLICRFCFRWMHPFRSTSDNYSILWRKFALF